MLYRLLRNNKEIGPFTTLQLKEMGLKPYDLLWTEGRGAAWQYASEIPELKGFAPVVEEQPYERFFKRKEALETAQQPVGSTKKTKPRFRISNGQLIMIEAGNMEVANNGTIKETVPVVRLPREPVISNEKTPAPEWKESYSEWQPQTQTKTTKTEEPVIVETKYSESLDDLKKRYAEKVLNERTTTPSSSFSGVSVKQNIMAALALLVLAVGGYIGYTLKQKDAAVTESKPAIERAEITGDNGMSSPLNDDKTAGNTSQTMAANTTTASNDNRKNETVMPPSDHTEKTAAAGVIKNKIIANEPQSIIAKKEENITAATHLPNTKTVDKTLAAGAKKTDAVKTTGIAAANKPLPQPQSSASSVAKNTGINPATTSPAETKPVVKQNVPKNINDYLSVKKLGGGSAGVQNVRLLVNNVSDFPIDLAVIDIQYFDNKGKYQKGETMYVKNIDGGNNVELRVPDSEKSSSIKYKVSLVSSEKKTLYLVAD